MFWYDGCLVNGSTVSLSVTDPGLLFGATVFTTLRVYDCGLGHPRTAWRSHVHRLQASVTEFSWTQPDWNRVHTEVEHLAQQYPVIRITLFPDGRELITGRSLPEMLDISQRDGVAAWLVQGHSFCRSVANHKTGNYLAPWRALNVARRNGMQEAILSNPSTGNWLETSTGNLIGWGNGKWWTPPLVKRNENAYPLEIANSQSIEDEHSEHNQIDQTSLKPLILPGIMRSQLISWLRCHNKEIVQAMWTPERVEGLEFVAYCNTVRQMIPIHTVVNEHHCLRFDAHHDCLDDMAGFIYS